MSEVKAVPISKSLLTQLPPQAEKQPEAKVDSRDTVIEELKQQVQQLEQTVAFLATFESNLLQSFDKEIALLREGATVTQHDIQKRSFRIIADSLERIRGRWINGSTFRIDRKKMAFIETKVPNE
jgi:hypothetical protein